MKLTQRELLFKLAACKGIGNLGLLKVLDFSIKYNDATDFSKDEIVRIANINQHWSIFSKSWDYWTLEPEKLAIYQEQHQFFTVLDPIYPNLLKQTYNCPALLCYQGNLDLLKTKCLAIVGTREASEYGKNVVYKLIPELIKNDLTIVSGLAKGIDGISHKTAIDSGGKTIAVIGTGLDHCYPMSNAHIQRTMMTNQLVLTEYLNGTPPYKYHFPMRNRVIAGLSVATCIIEAKEKSGSLITAQAALDYGRYVFAVPGNIFGANSIGCHKLIQDGAKCIVYTRDILEEL